MLIGYARVSRADQNLAAQTDELTRAGCERFFTDQMSGAQPVRPGLEEALSFAREGDTIVIVRLDRLARSLINFIAAVNDLTARKINIKSLHEGVDTSTSAGRTFCLIFSVLAEAEREWVIERTRAGLDAARERGKVGGRRRVMDDKRVRQAKALLASGCSKSDVCATMQVSDRTLRRYLAEG